MANRGGGGWARRRVRRDVPFSRLAATGRVGADFLDRKGAVDRGGEREPTGMVDDLEELVGPTFDPGRVDGGVRAFYEETATCTMELHPEWPPSLQRPAAVYHRFARGWLGQLALPVDPQRGTARLTSEVVPISAAVDGREGARAWIRRYADGDAMYVAVYTTYGSAGRSYLNVAFPLPGGNLSGILRAEHLGDGGLVLTSDGDHDEGLYLVRGGVGMRLPLEETLRVWADPDDGPRTAFDRPVAASRGQPGPTGREETGGADGERVFARHDVWCAGRRLFALHYRIALHR